MLIEFISLFRNGILFFAEQLAWKLLVNLSDTHSGVVSGKELILVFEKKINCDLTVYTITYMQPAFDVRTKPTT